MLRRGAATLALSLTLTGACGTPSPSSADTVVVNVAVSFDGHVDELPFDPRSERLAAALARLAELAGRRVAFRFDVALLPRYRPAFEELFIEAAEHAAQDLRYLSEREPEAYARARALLQLVECRYDAAAASSSAVFEASSKRLLVKLDARDRSLLGEGALARALYTEYEEHFSNRYASMPPEAVPVEERPTYFRFLSTSRALGRPADLSTAKGYLEDPAGVRILRAIELYRLVTDPALKGEIRGFLADQSGYFVQAYVHHPALVRAAPSASAFHRAETAWIGWMREARAAMTDAERLTLVKAIFTRQFNDQAETYGRYPDFAFPGVDKFQLGLEVVDEWRRAGHPITTPERPDRGELFEFIVCPHPKDERGHRSRVPHCNQDWYQLSFPAEAARSRLASAVLARRDPVFTEAVFVNVGLYGGVEALLDVWRAVDTDDATWNTATQVVAEEFAETSGDALLDEVRRVYRRFPARRGALAYVLSQVDRYGNGKVPWSDFARVFGAPLSQAEFAQFLDMGPRALSATPIVWPALARGFSRAAPVAARLDRLLDDPIVDREDPQAPWVMLRAVVSLLCTERRADELALLHARFQERATRKPSELRAFSNLIEDTRPGACR